VNPDEQRPENTVQENRLIEEGLEQLKAEPGGTGGGREGAGQHDPADDPPVDVATE
jgi:hypothetical protein